MRGVAAERSDRRERLAAGGGSPPTHAQHARRACSAGPGGTCAARRHRACAVPIQSRAALYENPAVNHGTWRACPFGATDTNGTPWVGCGATTIG